MGCLHLHVPFSGSSFRVLDVEVWCVVQLEEVSSRRVAMNQHATLPQMHQPTMMFSALPHDVAMAPAGMCSPTRATTSEGTSNASATASAGARNSNSASDQRATPAFFVVGPTALTAAVVSGSASTPRRGC